MAKEINGKRESIICAAAELFFKKGYNNTKIIEIAEAASIGKGTFYEYFTSKEALLEEIFNLKFEEDKKNIQLIYDKNISNEEKLISFVKLEIKEINEYGPNNNILAKEMMSSSFGHSDEVKSTIHKLFMYKYNFIKSVIDDGIKTQEFKPIDTSLASISLIGSISLYTGFKFDLVKHHSFSGIPFGNPGWKDEDFYNLIFTGLK